jgi:hypothetical protein
MTVHIVRMTSDASHNGAQPDSPAPTSDVPFVNRSGALPNERVMITTGIFYVMEHDGPIRYWIHARTYNKRPVAGGPKRVRGFNEYEKAVRFMRRATKDAITSDPTIRKWLVSYDGVEANNAAGIQNLDPVTPRKRGRPPGSKNAPKPQKPGPKPKPPEPKKRGPKPKIKPVAQPEAAPVEHPPVALTALVDRFRIEQELSNPIAQVWRCVSNTASMRGRAARTGNNQTGDLPHLMGSYLITHYDRGVYSAASDEDGVAYVYPTWIEAEREAKFYYEQAPEPKLPMEGITYYRVDHVEVHLTPAIHDGRPYSLFDTRVCAYVRDGRGYKSYTRLDSAKEAADEYADLAPFSVRLARALVETPEERANRERREELEAIEAARAQAERDRLYEEEMADLARRRANAPERRFLTPEEIAIEKAKRVQIINPTPEQKLAARRAKYVRRSYSDREARVHRQAAADS